MSTQTFAPIQKAPTLVEQVSLQLAQMFTNGSGFAGDKILAERNLAAQLGISRNVLREAIKRLEMQGLLEIRQGKGTRIVHKLHKPITAALSLLVPDETDRIQQLFEVRLILEPETARSAALNATEDDLLKITAAHKTLQDATTIEDATTADMHFHKAIAEASGNRILLLVIESLSELLAESQRIGFQTIEKSQPIPRHQEILDAITSHDGDAAAKAMATHILEARSIFGISAKRPLH